MLVIKFLLILPMAPLDHAVLSRLPGIDEKVHDTMLVAERVKRMHSFGHSIKSFVCARIPIRKDESVISFYRLNAMRESRHHISQKQVRVPSTLFVKDFHMPPSGSSINGGILKISFVGNASRDIFHINLNEFSGFSLCFDISVSDFLHSVFSHHAFFLQYFPHRTLVKIHSFFLKLPVYFQRALLCLFPYLNHSFLDPDRSFNAISFRFG